MRKTLMISTAVIAIGLAATLAATKPFAHGTAGAGPAPEKRQGVVVAQG